MKIKVKYMFFIALSVGILSISTNSCTPVRNRQKAFDSVENNKDKSNQNDKKFSTENVKKSEKKKTNTSSDVDKNTLNNGMANINQGIIDDKNSKTDSIDTINEKLTKNKQKSNLDKSLFNHKIKKAKDTTTINLDIEPTSYKDLADQFNNVVFDFDKEKYESACNKFNEFANSFPQTDSLYFESIFFVGECNIVAEQYMQAEWKFNKILDSPFAPSDIRQRALLRLGQIYCFQNKSKDALNLFDKLRKEFPKSVYLKLANCNFNNTD
jgi:TolA-binding protein